MKAYYALLDAILSFVSPCDIDAKALLDMAFLAHGADNSELDLQERHSSSLQPELLRKGAEMQPVRYAKPGRAARACRKCRHLKVS